MGRGDRRGATRLFVVNMVTGTVAWLLGEHHVATLAEFGYIFLTLSALLFTSSVLWLGYVAIEPFVRRQWPQVMVSWARLLAGDWRDPLVGRDILIGVTAGLLGVCWGQLEIIVPGWLGYGDGILRTPPLEGLTGPLAFLERMISSVYQIGLPLALVYLFFLFVLRMLLRNTWFAAVVAALILTPIMSGQLLTSAQPWVIFPVALGGNIAMLTVLIRFGFLATTVFGYVLGTIGIGAVHLTSDASSWYSGFGYAALGMVAALAVFGFKTSLGGRRVFELDDA
jgi:serine/threonine-protein kinase